MTLDVTCVRSCWRSRCAPWGGLCALVLVTLAASGAEAESALSLRWTAPAQCPTQAQVRALVQGMLGAEQPATATTLNVQAEVTVNVEGAVATLQFGGGDLGSAQRVLRAEDCAAVARASALVIAIAVDPAAAMRAPAPTQEPAPPAAPPTPPASPAPVPAAADSYDPTAANPWPPRVPASVTFEAGAALVLDCGMLPFLALGAEGALAVEMEALRVEITGIVVPAQDEETRQNPLVFTRLRLYGGALRAGYVGRAGPWSLSALAGVGWMTVSGTARGPNPLALVPRENADTFLAPDVGLAGELSLASWVALRALTRAAVPLSRRSFFIENLGRVHRVAVVSLVLGLGACVRL